MNEVGKITHYLGIKEDITGRILAQRPVWSTELAKPAPLDEEKQLLKTYDLSHFPCMESCIDTQEVVTMSKLDREHLTPAERALVKLKGLQSVVFIPLVLDGKTLGVLTLGSSRIPSSFAKTDLEICQVLVTQASMAIKNV